MTNIKRIFKLKLPPGQSAFLWGPRQTGKSTFLTNELEGHSYVDLLDSTLRLQLEKRPGLLREIVLNFSKESLLRPIIIDEVQKVPPLLDEVHWLIENKQLSFILCGSSARKLKRGQANLLGGRAWRFELFPFVSAELEDFNLLQALKFGLIPSIYLADFPQKNLEAYVINYLREEIQEEGIVRNIPAFSLFLDAASYTHGELLNYTNISRECGVSSKTVKEYF